VAAVAAQVSTTTGTVVSNSGGVLVVDTDSGQRTFMVDAQSSLPADLAAGTRVTVEYHTLANDKFHAFKVTPTSATAPSMTTDTTAAEAPMAPPADTNAAAPATAAPTMAAPSPAAPAPTTTTQTSPANTMGNTTAADTTTRTTDESTSTTGNRLPATASPLPLLALAGSLALAGGLLLRRRRA
jgi:LPXTG-motif cell wall-anchored protein